MNTKGIFFRNQLNGFNKDDVNNYIKSIDIKHSEEVAALNQTINDLNSILTQTVSERDEAKKTAESATELSASLEKKDKDLKESAIIVAAKDIELSNLQMLLDDSKTEIAELEKKLELSKSDDTAKLNSEISRLTALNEEKDNIIVSLNDEIERLNSTLPAQSDSETKDVGANTRDTAYKLEMYDKISNQIGDILLNANRSADDIVSAAKNEATRISSEAKNEADRRKEELKYEAENLKNQIIGISSQTSQKISNDIKESTEQYLKTLMSKIEGMVSDLQISLSSVNQSKQEISEMLDSFKSSTLESVENRMTEIKSKFDFLGKN